MNIAVGGNHRGELQPNAELLKRNGNRSEAGARLHNGKGKLASCQEARLFPVHRDQVGLGQNLQQVLVLKRLNHRAEVYIRTKNKKI